MRLFLFTLIVCSGLEISGYPIVDVLLLACFLFGAQLLGRTTPIRINAVFIFCAYLVLQTIRGMYVLSDYRMFYWALFFGVLYFSHLYLLDLYRHSRIDYRFIKKTFTYSSIYFLLYGLLGFFVTNPDDFQGIFWVGSSGAFIVIIPYICSHFLIFQHSGYSWRGLNVLSILLCVAVIVIHHSRIGLYLLLFYILLLLIQTLISKPRQLLVILSFTIISVAAWDVIHRAVVYESRGLSGQIANLSLLFSDSRYDQMDLGGDLGRLVMIQAIYNKFVSSPVELSLGSGWYTSRETLKPFSIALRSQAGGSGNLMYIDAGKPLQVITLAAIVSDTGMVGLLFILFFFWRSLRQILRTHCPGRMILIAFLLSNWIFYFVGYTFVSILAFLLFLPDGILVSLARAGALPTNRLINSEI